MAHDCACALPRSSNSRCTSVQTGMRWHEVAAQTPAAMELALCAESQTGISVRDRDARAAKLAKRNTHKRIWRSSGQHFKPANGIRRPRRRILRTVYAMTVAHDLAWGEHWVQYCAQPPSLCASNMRGLCLSCGTTGITDRPPRFPMRTHAMSVVGSPPLAAHE